MRSQKYQDIPLWVDQTLSSYGGWDAVQFLLQIGRLSQENYEAWRLGEVNTLEAVFEGSPKRIVEILSLALAHVQQRDLQASTQVWKGWGKHVDATLRLFADDAVNAQFSFSFSPAGDRPQLDLFMDAQHVVCFNRIRQGLIQRSPHLSAMFDDAFEDYADDPTLARLEALYVASQGVEYSDLSSCFLDLTQEITPLAVDELGSFSRHADDFLLPLWRNMAQALKNQPFDPGNPDFYAAKAWLSAKSYDKAIASVLSVPDWWAYPALHGIVIAAYMGEHNILGLRMAWLQFLLHCPSAASESVNDAAYTQGLQACGLLHWWKKFTGLEHRPTAADFPSWVLIQQPEYMVGLDGLNLPTHAAGQRFLWIKSLLTDEEVSTPHLDLRRKLKDSSFWLFTMLLKRRPGLF